MKRSYWQDLKGAFYLIWRNKWSFISVGILLQFVVGIGAAALSWVFQLALLLSGESNIDKNNLVSVMSHPLSLLALLIFIMVFAFLFMLEMRTLISVIYLSRTDRHLSFKKVLGQSFGRLKDLVGRNLLYFLLYLLLTLPVAGVLIGSTLTDGLYIPTFITGEFEKTTIGSIGLLVVQLTFIYLNLRLIYTVPNLVVEELPFGRALKKSWSMTKRGGFRLLWRILSFEFLLTFLGILLILGLVFTLTVIDKEGQYFWVETIFLVLIRTFLFIFTVLTKVGSLGIILDSAWEVPSRSVMHSKGSRKMKGLFALTVVFLMVQSGISVFELATLKVNDQIKLIAHRGDVSKGVENSLEALEAAAKGKAAYAEMDILLTKDHQFVVMHDYNLKRLAGVDKDVKDMTLAEVQGLKIQQDGHTSHIPSFEEYVKRAKELKMKLLVELKPHGAEPENYVDLFVQKMRDLGNEKDYPAMSLDLSVMEKVEKKAPEIKTGYVIPIQFGRFQNDSVDFFAIEDFSYQEDLVTQAHEMKKELYVWTINDKQKLTKYLQQPIDGLITDELTVAQRLKKDLKQNKSYFDRFLNLVATSKEE
ncbi:glycerophosphodiester phosphodiesterase [Streptococcus sp. 210928-DFI.4.42]|uniref:glycerophosphoryl diester phosphodiesterase membrane domain-containing protein n=1 Tax=Streptococcus sp. 210928-DFI.4.42 TaxID=2883234 RepID=UPI001D076158|nr:glycerophosphodiester phosphodiesterase [Streptococcus sp. 210928-DFI.4.42]MCB7060219.1 glycerophosphodiester phosphodiesterase [Streptococcus sp. 210928-DFI.4.42]